MIAARKRSWFNFFLRRWLAATLRRRFHGCWLSGAEHLRALAAIGDGEARPVIGCVNHTNWWDGFVLYVLSHRLLPHDIYLAMEEQNLRRYRFLAWMGVFGIDLADPRAALAGLRYAVRLLGEKADARAAVPKMVWIFVQGALVSPRVPVVAKAGAMFLARQSGAWLLPLVVRYDWRQESRPGIFVRAGAPMLPDTTSEALALRMNELLAETDADLERGDLSAWKNLLPAGMSMNKRWDYCKHLLSGGRRENFERHNG